MGSDFYLRIANGAFRNVADILRALSRLSNIVTILKINFEIPICVSKYLFQLIVSLLLHFQNFIIT